MLLGILNAIVKIITTTAKITVKLTARTLTTVAKATIKTARKVTTHSTKRIKQVVEEGAENAAPQQQLTNCRKPSPDILQKIQRYRDADSAEQEEMKNKVIALSREIESKKKMFAIKAPSRSSGFKCKIS